MTGGAAADLEIEEPDWNVLYRVFTADDRLLYVGISMGPATRIKQHHGEKPWWAEAHRIELEHFDSREAAAAAERQAIKSEKPLHNISGGRQELPPDERRRRREERERRKAEEADERQRIMDTTYTPVWGAECTNCRAAICDIPKGTLVSEYLCHHCGCQTVQLCERS